MKKRTLVLVASILICFALTACGSLSGSSTSTDAAPSMPKSVIANAVSPTQVDLYWETSSDDNGVSGYKIYRGGSFITNTTSIPYSDSGLNPDSQYCYEVSSYDTVSNYSGHSYHACTITFPDLSGTWAGSLTFGWDGGVASTNENVTLSMSLMTNTSMYNGTHTDSGGATSMSGTQSSGAFTYDVAFSCGTLTLGFVQSGGIINSSSVSGSACPGGIIANATSVSGSLIKQ